MVYFTASEVVTAAKMNSLVGYVLKTADESVTSSATLQNDDHLLYTIPGAGTYIIDVWLFVTSAANAAGDLQFGFTFPTGTMHVGVHGLDITLASGANGTSIAQGSLSAASGATVSNVGASTSTTMAHVHGILVATASGTLQFQWAQSASNVNATTVKAGSHLLVKQVA